MAGEIFVGSVGVSVVPDLSGFNDRMRAELVPSARTIGEQIGREMSRGISDNLNVTKTSLDGLRRSITDGLKDLKVNVGVDVTKTTLDELRKKINAGLDDVKVNVNVDVTKANLDAVKAKIKEGLDGIKVYVGIDVTKTNIAETRAKIREGLSDISVSVGTGAGGARGAAAAIGAGASGSFLSRTLDRSLIARLFGRGGGGGGGDGGGGGGEGGSSGGGGGVFGAGIAASLLPGGTRVSTGIGQTIAALPPEVQITGIAAAIAALPLIAQTAAGGIITALGGAFLGIGIYAAAQTKQVQAAWSKFTTGATAEVQKIGQSFAPVVVNIVRTLGPVVNELGQMLIGFLDIVGPPFQIFADTIINGLASPHVSAAIHEIGVAFGGLLTAFTPDIPGIINSMADAIERIAAAVAKNPKAFADFVNFLFQLVIVVLDGIAFLTDFADYVEFHFMPAMDDIGTAFVDTGHAIEAAWDTTWNNTVGRTERGLHDTADAFDSGRHDIASSWSVITGEVTNDWNSFWNNTVTRTVNGVKDVVNFVSGVKETLNVWHQTDSPARAIWDAMWLYMVSLPIVMIRNIINAVTQLSQGFIRLLQELNRDSNIIWGAIWNSATSLASRGRQNIVSIYSNVSSVIGVILRALANVSAVVWGQVWDNTIGQAIRGYQRLQGVFTTLKNWVVGFFSGAGSWLYDAGSSIIGGLFNGIQAAMKDVNSWIKRYVVDPLINAVKYFFGIHSPATAMMPIGSNVIKGLIQGMLTTGVKDLGGLVGKIFGGWPQALGSLVSKSFVDIAKLPAKAISALAGLTGDAGRAISGFFSKMFGGFSSSSGVGQWSSTVAQALSMLGLPLSLGPQVLYQMQTESGGNPNAINNSDINAQMGDPSRGLMQVIGSTFAAYHVAGTSENIYDPLANIAAAIAYASYVYGPTLMRGGMGIGSGHGYDAGGYAPPGASWFWNGTGKPEPVLTDSQWSMLYNSAQGGDGGTEYHAHFDGLTGDAIESHVRTAFGAMNLQQGAMARQGRRR